ncbi:MAG: tetratricopeptide repeat protein [Ruminococcaceae bacterium]|nr:tetratricopeptide repeat protein [Oscillospiraceae bacterium]
MKRYVVLLIIFVLCVSSWVVVIKKNKSGTNDFNRLIVFAEEANEKKIYDEALDYYKKALKIKPNDKKALFSAARICFELEDFGQAKGFCERILKNDVVDVETTLLLAEIYESGGDYVKAVEILRKVEQTEKVKKRILKLCSKYTLKYMVAKEPKSWYKTETLEIAVVKDGEFMAVYNSSGNRVLKEKLVYIGVVSEDLNLYPCIHEGKRCFIDKSGQRRLVPEEDYEYLGPFYSGLAVAKIDGKYGYIDKELNQYNFIYENAYNFTGDFAVVKLNGQIQIIDKEFNVINSTDFEGIVSDEYGFTNKHGRMIMILNDKYYICDEKGNRISDFNSDYICLPNSKNEPLAFKKEGKWGYVSSGGKVLIKPQFYEAKSFSNGFGAVKVGGKWGYIDEKGTLIIPAKFTFAGEISGKGSAFVSNEAGTALMTLCAFRKGE